MEIAGGLYRELCETPSWDGVYGSGGRAAHALAQAASGTRLHTYVSIGRTAEAADALDRVGVWVEAAPRETEIVFSYLHPLSKPHIEPQGDQFPRCAPLYVSGSSVLRFGFLEGEAVVDAGRAVFDPQTARASASFRANGSKAGQLALVLNEGEVRALAGADDLTDAARQAMATESAEVLIMKRGVHGALAFVGDADPVIIPPYRSQTVFKIGTGDVFSAWFAHYWAECGTAPVEAADLASRAVAAYAGGSCASQLSSDSVPIFLEDRPGWVRLVGEPTTLGRRFVLEEIRYILRDMGLNVVSPGLDGIEILGSTDVILAVAEATKPAMLRGLAKGPDGPPLIILDETRRRLDRTPGRSTICTDFTTAIYQTAWAALENRRRS